MTMGKLCYALVAALFVTMTGCGDVRNANEGQNESENGSQNENENEGQTSQAITTGCELDCWDGSVFTCPSPCSVTATTLNCNGSITSCPPVQSVCGNRIVEGIEACDDGNTRAFDRCSPDCLHA